MAERKHEITIEGIVQRESLDAILVSHRLSIVGKDGHVYEVEPSYVGAYLQRCEGQRVIARAELLHQGNDRSVVRISSLTTIGHPPVRQHGEAQSNPCPHGA